ncbi:MAG: peptidylprolyl isomerase [bacterium]|nr:peptidylprolyl isomerase [bacterium]
MRTKTCLALVLLSLTTLGCGNDETYNPQPTVPTKTKEIAATVDKLTLTKDEVATRVNLLISELPKENAPTPEQMDDAREMFSKNIVNTFIQSNMIRVTAEREGIIITDEMREKAYVDFKARTGKDFKTETAKLKPEMRKIVEDELEASILLAALVEKNVYAVTPVNEAEVTETFEKVKKEIENATTDFTNYYNQLKAKTITIDELSQKAPRFLPPQGLKQKISVDEMARLPQKIREVIEATPVGQISEIKELSENDQCVKFYVSVTKSLPPMTKLEALTKIQALKKQLDEGASFEILAKENSACPSGARAGGDLGDFSRGMMVKAFEDAAFSLPLNVISEPVETDFGYHLIKVTARDEGKGTARASHILLAPTKAAMEVSIVSTLFPAKVSIEDIRETLKARDAEPKLKAYLDSIRANTTVTCPAYPDLIAQ